MSRMRGTFVDKNNYEVTAKRPYDARMLVPTYGDLTIKDNWLALDPNTNEVTTSLVAFNGLIVAVADKNDAEHSGLYMLYDRSGTKNPNVESIDNWVKIGETPVIVETIGYRSKFPTEGKANTLYVAVDEQKSYVWVNDDYLPIGGSDYEEPTIICGGTSHE